MAYDSMEFEDPYRKRVLDDFDPTRGTVGPGEGGGYDGSGINPGPYGPIVKTGGSPAPTAAPAGGYDLEAFRKRWTGSGDVNNAQGWLDANRDITQGVTLRNEKAYDPSGRFIADLVGNFSGADPSQRSRIFLDGIGSDGKARTATGTRGTTTATGTGGKAAAPAQAANPFLTNIRKLIMDRIGAMGQQPSLSDPALAAQSQSYARSRNRGADQDRAEMAERNAFTGLNSGGQGSGAFDTDLRSIRENASEDISANDAAILGHEMDQRRSELNSLMAMALDSGDAESARLLSRELAQLDAQLRREGLREGARQFDADLGYRNNSLNQQRYMYDDTMGYNQSRASEDDYRWRSNQLLGGL